MDILNNLLDRLAGDMDDNDRIRLVITHPALDHSINLPFMRRDQLDAERTINEIELVLQSNEGFAIAIGS